VNISKEFYIHYRILWRLVRLSDREVKEYPVVQMAGQCLRGGLTEIGDLCVHENNRAFDLPVKLENLNPSSISFSV
jgi:hypothetical protein